MRRSSSRAVRLWLVGAATAAWPSVAGASPEAEVVATGGGAREPLVRTSVEYTFSSQRSELVREDSGGAADPLSPVPLRADLDAENVRHTITPRLDVAFASFLSLSLALPYVAADARSLSLHSGVDRASSSTLRDGLLPMSGYDADNPATGFPDGSAQIFRGPGRSGLDQVHVGLGVLLMNQHRDSSKPTWKLGVEGAIAIGRVARFDSTAPSANDAVGRGVHEIGVWTSVAKRIAFVEPYFALAWRAPVLVKDASLFSDLGYGATNVKPPQTAQIRFGTEAIALERPARHLRVGVDLGARLDARFEGRDYSEMWEVFALAGNASTAGAPLVLDADPTAMGRQDLSHPGVSNVENHLEVAGKLAVRAQLSRTVRFSAMAELAWRTDHAITFADAGIDLPSCEGGQTTGCETLSNDLVDEGTAEENPAFAPLVDLVGRRYRSVQGAGLVVGVELVGAF